MSRQRGSQHWTQLHPEKVARGATHPCSKLGEAEREELRELAERWRPSALAEYYKLSRTTIWRYLRNT